MGAITQVEAFQMRFLFRDLILTKDASEYEYEITREEQKTTQSFAVALSKALTEYQSSVDFNQPFSEQLSKAGFALYWINIGYARNFIVEGPSLMARLELLTVQNKFLTEKLDKADRDRGSLSKEKGVLTEEKEALRKRLDEISAKYVELQKEKSFYSNVEPVGR